MDYSTLKNIKSPQEINNIDAAIDLSDNYVNDNNEEILEKKYSSSTIINNNNNNLCTSDGNLNNSSTLLLNDLNQETKLKLNFSVDRILGNDHNVNSDKLINYIAAATTTSSSSSSSLSHCSDCSLIGNGVQNIVANNSNEQKQPIFSVPFTTMINLSKSIVRPMPVRYLTRAPTGIITIITLRY